MKKLLFIQILFLSAILVCVTACSNKNKSATQQKDRAAYYIELIKNTSQTSHQELGIPVSEDELSVYGFITSQNVMNLFVTVYAAYADGSSADIIYNGHSIILPGDNGFDTGLSKKMKDTVSKFLNYYKDDIEKYWKGQDESFLSKNLLMTSLIEENTEEMKSKVKELVAESSKYFDIAKVGKELNLPEPDHIKIIFLTNIGNFAVEFPTAKLLESGYQPLFRSRSFLSHEIADIYAPPQPKNANIPGGIPKT